MIGRIREHVRQWRRSVPADRLLEAARQIRRRSDVIALTPAPQGSFWIGIHRATHAIFPERVLDLPYPYGAGYRLERDVDKLARGLATEGFSQVILSGFPFSFERLARRLHRADVKVGVLYHGFLAACGLSPMSSLPLDTILRLLRERIVAKVGCNKKGLPETIRKLTGLDVHKFLLPTRVPATPVRSPRPEGPHIGVLGEDHFRKNIHNQVAAALLVDGTKVHVSGAPEVHYLGSDRRIVRHPPAMPHHRFVALLGEMDVNLHLSFSESWGQLTAESLAMGVPCLIANHSDVYDFDPDLRALLVSDHFDDPPSLARDIERVLPSRKDLSFRCVEYVSRLNAMAEQSVERFLAL